MNDVLLNEIRAGLGLTSWDESIDAVQTTVANAISRLDRRVRIRRTGYFNHSFVPDLTLTWPGAEAPTRDTFLRLGMTPDALLDDLTTLDASEPILLDVGASISQADARRLAEVADGHDALLADLSAVTALEPEREGRYAEVLPSSMLKGGRGVVGGAEARSINGSAAVFFNGVETHRRQNVEEGADVLVQYLSRPAYHRLANLGRTVWEATGGDPTSCPLPSSDTDAFDDDSLFYLLQRGPAGDPDFWRSVGRALSLDRLVNLDAVQTRNLRNLVAANIDRLRAGVVVIRPIKVVEAGSSDEAPRSAADGLDRTPHWSISNGVLLYHGTTFTAHIASSRERAPEATYGHEWHPRLADLVTRLGVLPVVSIAVTTPDGRSVNVRSATGLDILADATLRDLVSGPSIVDNVGIRTDESMTLTCCFSDLSAAGPSGSSFHLAHLLRAALPVLTQLSHDDLAEMRRTAAYNARVRPRNPSADDDLGPW